MQLKAMCNKVVFFVLIMVGIFGFDPRVCASGNTEELFEKTRKEFNEEYILVSTERNEDSIKKRYRREGTVVVGNTCSVWIEVRTEYTLVLCLDVNTEQIISSEFEKEVSRELHNGLE